jgi:hypothetical protein
MWLENINKNIELITEITNPKNKGDVNKLAKEIRDKTIIKTVTEFKKGVIFLKHRHSKNIDKPFKEIAEELSLHDCDKLINAYTTEIEVAQTTIIEMFNSEMQDEIKKILNDILDETIIETTFEFQKGVESLDGHISKNIDN